MAARPKVQSTAEEILQEPKLKAVFEAALEKGAAMITVGDSLIELGLKGKK